MQKGKKGHQKQNTTVFNTSNARTSLQQKLSPRNNRLCQTGLCQNYSSTAVVSTQQHTSSNKILSREWPSCTTFCAYLFRCVQMDQTRVITQKNSCILCPLSEKKIAQIYGLPSPVTLIREDSLGQLKLATAGSYFVRSSVILCET